MAEVDANKAAVRRFYEEVVAAGHVELLESLVAPDVFDHGAEQMGWPAGREGFRQHVQWVHDGVSDRRVVVDDLVSEGDRVVAFWTLSGVHSGDFFGAPASGRSFAVSAVSLLTFRAGVLVEYMVRPDALGLLQQLGALPR